jgi:hypothetical protein
MTRQPALLKSLALPSSWVSGSKLDGHDGWVHRILQCVWKYKEEELVADDEQEDDGEFAHTDDDAARWLINYLGDCYPKEFIKSAQALDMPIQPPG